ncbi:MULTISPECIES: DsrE family protein [Azospirillum]|nr:DsrE family protein [Azospirillum brasilense]
MSMDKPMQRVQKPVIDGFGGAWFFPNAALRFDPALDYKVVFSVTQAPPEEDRVNPGLERVARFLNLYAADVGSAKRLDVVVVGAGAATRAMLADDAHRRLHSGGNPNALLLERLDEQGVRLFVCGQALAERGLEPEATHPCVGVALSAMTAVADCQLRGFALLSY